MAPAGSESGPRQCMHCSTEAAACFCVDCDAAFCDQCFQGVHRAPNFRSHQSKPLPSSLCAYCHEQFEELVACAECGSNYCKDCSALMHRPPTMRGHSIRPLRRERAEGPALPSGPDSAMGAGRGTTEHTGADAPGIRAFTRNIEMVERRAGAGSRRGGSTRERILLFVGPSGVGKSTTINNIVGREVCEVNAFMSQQADVFECEFQFQDTKLRIIDTPGIDDEASAEKIRAYVATLPEVHSIFYVERFDSHRSSRTSIKLITEKFGSRVWDHTFCVLTHGATLPADPRTTGAGEGPPRAATPAPPPRPDAPSAVAAVLATAAYTEYSGRRTNALQNEIGRISGNTRRRVPVAVVENNFTQDNSLFSAFIERVPEFLERRRTSEVSYRPGVQVPGLSELVGPLTPGQAKMAAVVVASVAAVAAAAWRRTFAS